VKIELWSNQLEDGQLGLLGRLPKLMQLKLCEVYGGSRLIARQGEFQNLRKLTIWGGEAISER
jgi:hypothetical protein